MKHILAQVDFLVKLTAVDQYRRNAFPIVHRTGDRNCLFDEPRDRGDLLPTDCDRKSRSRCIAIARRGGFRRDGDGILIVLIGSDTRWPRHGHFSQLRSLNGEGRRGLLACARHLQMQGSLDRDIELVFHPHRKLLRLGGIVHQRKRVEIDRRDVFNNAVTNAIAHLDHA